MSEQLADLTTLRRPGLLIRAARHGVAEYDRNRDLRRILRTPTVPTPKRALGELMTKEAEIEETRKTGDASYSVVRHLNTLIAMMAESRLLL